MKPRVFTKLITDDKHGKEWAVYLDTGQVFMQNEFLGYILKQQYGRDEGGSEWLYKTTFPGTTLHRSYHKAVAHYRKMWLP